MELIDDWGDRARVGAGRNDPAAAGSLAPATAKEIGDQLAQFKPVPLNVHLYEDVGYPWVEVVFDDPIGPAVALGLGAALEQAAGAGRVYLNSLRPKAVNFLLDPPFEPPPELKAERYGAPMNDIRSAWAAPAAKRR